MRRSKLFFKRKKSKTQRFAEHWKVDFANTVRLGSWGVWEQSEIGSKSIDSPQWDW